MKSPLVRHADNPILTAKDAPYHCSLLFNAGICKFNGRYVMVFRNDYGAQTAAEFEARHLSDGPNWDGTNLGLAFSDDGVKWSVQPEPCITLERAKDLIAPLLHDKDPQTELKRFYDPRLTVIDGRVYMCFAIDTAHGLRGGVAVTDDFESWEVLSASVPDNRNMVLFPEKIGGRFVRFERPVNAFGGNVLHGHQAMMWMSYSPDCRYWGDSQHILESADVEWANDKLGPAAPPIRTDKGWLATFHAVHRDDTRGKNGWEEKWVKTYTAGLMLLDLENPAKIIRVAKAPLLPAEAWYETGVDVPEGEDPGYGFRNHVIFPGGMLLEDDGQVKVYYGAADTVECLATAHVDDLVKFALEG